MPSNASFREVRFPTNISFGSAGGPRRNTEIVVLGSGREQRNQRWSNSMRRYDAGYGVRDLNLLHEVVEFYEAQRGPLYGFRYRDPLDWKSCLPLSTPAATDQLIGVGDDSEVSFQLNKTYGQESDGYVRIIEKPVEMTVLVAINSVSVPQNEFSVDYASGTIEFDTPPASESTVTAGFEFDVPVRFESDELLVNLAAFEAGDIPSIPLMEIAL